MTLPDASITIRAESGSRISTVVVWYLHKSTSAPVNISAGAAAQVEHFDCLKSLPARPLHELSTSRALHAASSLQLVPMAALVQYPEPVETATITIARPRVPVVSVSMAGVPVDPTPGPGTVTGCVDTYPAACQRLMSALAVLGQPHASNSPAD